MDAVMHEVRKGWGPVATAQEQHEKLENAGCWQCMKARTHVKGLGENVMLRLEIPRQSGSLAALESETAPII